MHRYVTVFEYASAYICIYVRIRALLRQAQALVVQHGVGVGRDGGLKVARDAE